MISMPRYFKPWGQGLPELREHLKSVGEIVQFSGADRKTLEERMRADGLVTDRGNSMAFTGRGQPLLAVFDPASLKIEAILKPDHARHRK